MDAYVPLEDIIVGDISQGINASGIDRYHLELSANEVAFTKNQQEKTVLVRNIGWDKLNLIRIVNVNSLFVIDQSLPAVLLPNKSYPIRITFNASNIQAGGFYVDVGDSYGNKFVALTGRIDP